MTQFYFGVGNMYVLPPTALTPIKLAAIQDVSVDFDGDQKSLFGQNQFPVSNARGKTKITGKFAIAKISLDAVNTLFFNQTVAVGQIMEAVGEAETIPTTPYQVTVANGANFKTDLGVFNAATGAQLTRVVSGPTTGQYSVNTATGVYTFAAADTTNAVLIDYEWNSTATGKTLTGNNVLMGAIPLFSLRLNNTSFGQQSTLRLFSCVSNKLQLPMKLDDYMIQSFDFSAQDDGSGKVFAWSTTET